eukprot:5823698-Lingulodinium_polyedra.AAC.1
MEVAWRLAKRSVAVERRHRGQGERHGGVEILKQEKAEEMAAKRRRINDENDAGWRLLGVQGLVPVQILGDSMLVVNWLRARWRVYNQSWRNCVAE